MLFCSGLFTSQMVWFWRSHFVLNTHQCLELCLSAELHTAWSMGYWICHTRRANRANNTPSYLTIPSFDRQRASRQVGLLTDLAPHFSVERPSVLFAYRIPAHTYLTWLLSRASYMYPKGQSVNPDLRESMDRSIGQRLHIQVTQDQHELYSSIDYSFEVCKICNEREKDVRMDPCGHLLCSECLNRWSQTNTNSTHNRGPVVVQCPYCRAPVSYTTLTSWSYVYTILRTLLPFTCPTVDYTSPNFLVSLQNR